MQTQTEGGTESKRSKKGNNQGHESLEMGDGRQKTQSVHRGLFPWDKQKDGCNCKAVNKEAMWFHSDGFNWLVEFGGRHWL